MSKVAATDVSAGGVGGRGKLGSFGVHKMRNSICVPSKVAGALGVESLDVKHLKDLHHNKN